MMILSCNNGAYDANPNTNNGGIGVPNTGGGGSGGGGSFDWSGTDPISAKVEGQSFHALLDNVVSLNGTIAIQGVDAGTGTSSSISLTFPENTTAGTTISLNTASFVVYMQGADSYTSVMGGSGAIKVLENDATHVKGLFYATVKSMTGGSNAKTITEGYFNVTK